jgi:glycine betaine catabolism A
VTAARGDGGVVRRDASMSRTLQAALPKHHYVSADSFAAERERVLVREWTCVGRLDDLGLTEPGSLAVVEAHGESVVIAQPPDGELAGHYNVCRHRGSQLFPTPPGSPPTPQRPARAIRCPYHSWTYDLDGRLLRAPHTDDVDDFDPAQFGLHAIGVEAWAGFCFVNLDRPDVPLADSVTAVAQRISHYPLDRLRTGWRRTYDVAANWKLICENYNECYHCAGVHPELCRLVPAFAHGGRDLQWDEGVPHRDGAWTFTTTGTSRRKPFADLSPQEQARHKGELIYPNVMLSLAAEHVAAFVLWPVSAGHTRIDCLLLFDPDEMADPSFDPSDAAELWELVNGQDWAICESVQRGMSSRAYTGGWFAPMEDESLDIRRWLLPRLESS